MAALESIEARVRDSGLVDGNRLGLLESGNEYFPALEACIDAAHTEIHLQTYIFADDVSGRRIAAALVRAARRGVIVAVIIDGFGSRRYVGTIVEDLRAAGIEVAVFRPELGHFNLDRQRLRRMHRKLAVIDGAIAFVGGINIIDDMHTPGQKPPRRDYGVCIEGPLALEVTYHARHLWTVVDWATFGRRAPLPPQLLPQLRVDPPWNRPPGPQRAAFVVRDNFRHRSDIEDAYLDAIESAREEIVLATAYFFPGRLFRRSLVQAAERGVRVILILQGRVEYVLMHYASRALYGALLEAGVQIFQYHESFLHAKVAVVDRRWATVGSSNIDPFSLLLAREANVVIDDEHFAGALRMSLEKKIQEGATPLAKQSWQQRGTGERVLDWIGYGIARFLIGMYGYGGRH